MTDPGAFELIGAEHNIVLAHALTTATTAAAYLITVILSKLAFPLPGGTGTNLDFGLDSHRILALDDGRCASGVLSFYHTHSWRWIRAWV